MSQGLLSAHQVAAALAGKPVKSHGGNYLVCCPVHDDKSPSLSLCDGDRGLMVHCFVGCSPGDIYAAIRRRGFKLDQSNVERTEPAKGSSEYQRQQHDKAAWLWSRRRPIEGTIAEKYLRERRRISCPLPQTLAYLPPRKPEYHPAMIGAFALVDEPEPNVVGMPSSVGSVHLTFLKRDGSDKADVEKPRRRRSSSVLPARRRSCSHRRMTCSGSRSPRALRTRSQCTPQPGSALGPPVQQASCRSSPTRCRATSRQ